MNENIVNSSYWKDMKKQIECELEKNDWDGTKDDLIKIFNASSIYKNHVVNSIIVSMIVEIDKKTNN